ncbi:DUF3817 domain-containing protein [Gracilibacillus thailandensis]|uniref:DUF3817 domain-containing protein n=1 Tax=Gracilibacillus thailandensis TaxID=563735 RepID=A0A6N7R0R1_9BACI|nr:DUF3817 domain-containing protein [Gracilibacillus thailandensis]MRI65819.1 DUF3817 domain-containing protein [Gracilibacillus thailandensis]
MKDIKRFRILGIIEGASLVILLFLAMPLKYWGGLPEIVTVVGSIHGALFIVYILFTLYTTFKVRWSFIWLFSAVAVAFIPFGNFVLDRRIQAKYS